MLFVEHHPPTHSGLEHTLWPGRPQACLLLIVFLHCLLLMKTLLQTPFRSPSALFFPASPGRSKKVLGQKRPILRALREKPKNCCENWTTVYSGHKIIGEVSQIRVCIIFFWLGASTHHYMSSRFLQYCKDPIGLLK